MSDVRAAAELFVEHGYIWPSNRERRVRIRIRGITAEQAMHLASTWPGSISRAFDGTYTWEPGVKQGFEFLLAISNEVRLRPEWREDREQ